ncbi:MAG: stage III sporulation protein AB [Clostridia bacterium]|nr:stage III sporulation protein AB [Clostridia bacterium]
MYFIVKWCGMLLLFCSCTLVGFQKSAALHKRVKLLDTVDEALEELEQLVRCDGRERACLLRETFGKRGILENSVALLQDDEDRRLVETFLREFGRGDAAGECKRITLCRGLLQLRRKSARQLENERSRVYRVAGICLGAAGCIFWI